MNSDSLISALARADCATDAVVSDATIKEVGVVGVDAVVLSNGAVSGVSVFRVNVALRKGFASTTGGGGGGIPRRTAEEYKVLN